MKKLLKWWFTCFDLFDYYFVIVLGIPHLKQTCLIILCWLYDPYSTYTSTQEDMDNHHVIICHMFMRNQKDLQNQEWTEIPMGIIICLEVIKQLLPQVLTFKHLQMVSNSCWTWFKNWFKPLIIFQSLSLKSLRTHPKPTWLWTLTKTNPLLMCRELLLV